MEERGSGNVPQRGYAMVRGAYLILVGAAIALPLTPESFADGSWWPAPAATDTSPSGRYHSVEPRLADIIERREQAWKAMATQDYERLQTRSTRLNRLLDAAVGVLAEGEATRMRRQIRDLEADLRAQRSRLARLRTELATAPASACADPGGSLAREVKCALMPDARTSLEADIRAAEERVAELQAERTRFLADLAASLQALGVALPASDLEALLVLVSADHLIDAYAAYRSLAQVNAALVRAAEAADGDVEILERYYGFHVVLVEICLHLHETFLDDIEGKWLPRLAVLRGEAEAARRQAQHLLGQEGASDLRARLTANVAANDLSIRAADLYARHLRNQARAATDRWAGLYRRHQIALNTYRTIVLQGDVLAIMQQSSRGFAELVRLELPPLRDFESTALRDAVAQLSERLRLSNL